MTAGNTTTDILNAAADRIHVYPSWVSRVSVDGTPPRGAAATAELVPERVQISAGGQNLDHASFRWALSSPLTDRQQPSEFSRMVDVLLPPVAPDFAQRRLFVGDYTTESERYNSGGEELVAEAHTRNHHFGDQLQGELWYSPTITADGVSEVVANSLVRFNPRVDGRVLPNMNSVMTGDAHYWIHPEASLTSNAENWSSQTASKWTLSHAVMAICAACNPDEVFIKNPTPGDLQPLEDAPDIEAVELPRGLYLPQYLDRLLHPLGCNWYVDYICEGGDGWDSENKPLPRLRFFMRGDGDEKTIRVQVPGSTLDLHETNCHGYRVDRRIGDAFNAVRVMGSREKKEITLELFPGWLEDYDSLTTDDLVRSAASSQYEARPTVHRLWCANEAGDLTGLRTNAMPAGEPPALDSLFAVAVPHRRSAGPPLTYIGQDGQQTRRDIKIDRW